MIESRRALWESLASGSFGGGNAEHERLSIRVVEQGVA